MNKFIFELRNDCSIGFDNIPVKPIKPVAEDITSPIVNIINSSIDKEIFPDSWEVTRVCPVPKIDNPIYEKDYLMFYHYPSCLKPNSIQYADDTSLYLSNSIRNIQCTISILKNNIKNINTWSENNGLVFNNEKLLSLLSRQIYQAKANC